MIRPGIVWALARAESRLTRRLVRFWMFVGVAALFTFATFGWFAFIHGAFGWASASAASANPRFFAASLGGTFLALFALGLIFIGFDVRGRDARERMAEVLDSLPYSNLELLLGRFLGVLIPSWIALAVIIGILEVIGLIVDMPIQPWSLLTMLVLIAIPSLALTLSFVYLFSVLLQNRLIAAVALVPVILVPIVVPNLIPIGWIPLLDINGGWVLPWPSDIISGLTASGVAQRIGLLLGAMGILGFASVLHPRRDDARRGLVAAVSTLLIVAALAPPVWIVMQNRAGVARRAAWSAAHEQLRGEPVPDVTSLGGQVAIYPGKRIEADLTLVLRAPQGATLDEAIFTLNPGMTVESVRASGGGDLTFRHDDGLLRVTLGTPVSGEQESELAIVLGGKPDRQFPYFDQALDPMQIKGFNGQIIILGRETVLFTPKFAALLPGQHWLPASGTQLGPEGAGGRQPDFFALDLQVEVPEGWLVAGPGKRQDAAGGADKRSAFRFAPPAPVPSVPLVASRFMSVSTEIDGVTLEALHHPAHVANFELFEDAAPYIHEWLKERLDEAREVGLAYPYDGLTMVEVPNHLRGYAGGWRMGSTLGQPGMILMRESGFPTAYYKKRFDDPTRWERFDNGIPEGKRWVLETFFENDFNGGNPFIAAARSFFAYQTTSVGPDAVPLDWVFDDLTTRLLTDKSNYFSVHFFDQQFGQRLGEAGAATQGDDAFSRSYAETLIHLVTSRAEIWDAITEVALADIDPWENPEEAINVLSLKGDAMARSMLDAFGQEKVGQFLAALRDRAMGGTFTRDDVIQAGTEVGLDLDRWLGIWLEQTALPGFTLGDAVVERINDDDDGTPRYQARITIRNDEEVPGLLTLEYTAGDSDSGRERGASDPVEIAGATAVEVGLVTSKPLSRLRVKPYLALNRDPFVIPLPGLDEERVIDAEPFEGTRVVDWTPPDTGQIVVDDLDNGFSIVDSGGRSLRVSGKALDKQTDQGLPVHNPQQRGVPKEWSRANRSTAWGKYRRTLALVRGGSGDKTAVFSAEIPRSGQWQLEYHLPRPRRSEERGLGTWNFSLVDDSGAQSLQFDAKSADTGWNTLDTFEIAAGEVRVEVSDQTDGKHVIADAIRWTPVTRSASSSTP